MKKLTLTLIIINAVVLGIFTSLSGCKKEDDNNHFPLLETAEVSDIAVTTATCGGDIISEGDSLIIASGVCWSIFTKPTIADSITIDGTGEGKFISVMTGLTPNTVYYVRAYATNSAGTSYGNQRAFKTYSGTVIDMDGNIYYTITVHSQVWMAENLKTTKYNDGTAIPLVTDGAEWSDLTTPGYCWYNNDSTIYKNIYGALYNWFAINTGKLAPFGWHVSSDAEWEGLIDYLFEESIYGVGGRLKEKGTVHWQEPNEGATNEISFTALPGGFRYYTGHFNSIGTGAYWWSATESGQFQAWYRYIYNYEDGIFHTYDYWNNGFSVRCLMDD